MNVAVVSYLSSHEGERVDPGLHAHVDTHQQEAAAHKLYAGQQGQDTHVCPAGRRRRKRQLKQNKTTIKHKGIHVLYNWYFYRHLFFAIFALTMNVPK